MNKTQMTVEEYEQKLHDSFRFFLREVLRAANKHLPDPIQYDVSDWIQNGPRLRGIRGLRYLSKTFIACVYALWRLYRNSNERILIVSAAKKNAAQSFHMIRGWILKIPFLRHLAPRAEIKHGPNARKWRDSGESLDVGPSEIDRTPSVTCIGLGGQLPGNRATLIIADDIETKKNTVTQNLRKTLRDDVDEFVSIVGEIGDVIFLGTPHHQESLYDHLQELGYAFRSWPIRYPTAEERVPCLAPQLQANLEKGLAKPGDSTWPERFDNDTILELKVSRTTYLMQYMVVSHLSDQDLYPIRLADFIVYPTHRDQAPVSIAWGTKDNNGSTAIENIESVGFGEDKFHGPIMVDKNWKPYHGTKAVLDPAGRGADEMTWAIAGQLYGNIFVKHVGACNGGATSENLTQIVLDLKRHGADELHVESNFGGDAMAQLLETHIARHCCKPEEDENYPQGWNCTVILYPASGQKELRIINAIEPAMNSHRIIIDPSVAANQKLWQQGVNITRDRNCLEHDDRIEAFAECIGKYTQLLNQDQDAMAKREKKNIYQRMLDKYARLCKPKQPTNAFRHRNP